MCMVGEWHGGVAVMTEVISVAGKTSVPTTGWVADGAGLCIFCFEIMNKC